MTPAVFATLFVALSCAIVLSVWIVARHLSASRRAKAALTTGEEYRSLADEYRRLTDMAITAQEHTDFKLTDISVRIDALQDRLEQMQRILKEVE
jgi:hypothetical protein